MPSYVVLSSGANVYEPTEATLCDLSITGQPDRKTDVPVRAQLVSEQVLNVDGVPRRLLASQSNNGVMTFLIDGSSKALRHRERRGAVARVSGLLRQLQSALIPLVAESAMPEVVAPALQELFDWLASERKSAMSDWHGASKEAPHDHAR